jgi:TPR repeat protein
MMKHCLPTRAALAALLLLPSGCATAPLAAPRAAIRPAPRTPEEATGHPCAAATFGIEAVDASRALRRAHGLSADLHGAMVIEVLPGSPAAKAGLAAGDLLEKIGLAQLSGYSGFFLAEKNLGCDRAVEIVAWRGTRRLTKTIQPVDAVAFHGDACAHAVAYGCFELGWLRIAGAGVPKDQAGGEQLYRQACNMGSGTACAYLTSFHQDDADWAEERFGLDERSCENLALLYQSGRGVPASAEKAAILFDLACQGAGIAKSDTEGCLNLGRAYRYGAGVEPDPDFSAKLFDDVCRRLPDPADPSSRPHIARPAFSSASS